MQHIVGSPSHRLVAGIVRMNIIAAIVSRENEQRVIRVAHGSIEIDYCIVRAAGADPVVNRLASRFYSSSESRRNQGATIDPETRRFGSNDELLMTCNNSISGHPTKQIIGTDEHDEVCNARLGQHITIEPRLSALTPNGNVEEQKISSDALVEHAHSEPSVRSGEQPRKGVRITGVGAGRGSNTICD